MLWKIEALCVAAAVTASVLAGVVASPARADPLEPASISAEHPVSAPIYRRASDEQEPPKVASNGDTHLAVWRDNRNTENHDFHLYATRVRPDGELLDRAGFVVSSANVEDFNVLSDGSAFYVVWSAFDESIGSDSIFLSKIASTGEKLYDIRVGSNPNGYVDAPAAAFNGTNLFVIWLDGGANPFETSTLRGALVSLQGDVLQPGGVRIAGNTVGDYPQVAAASDAFVVVWEDHRAIESNSLDIYGARVTSDGAVLDSDGFAIADDASYSTDPSVVVNGTRFLVAWDEYRAQNDSDVMGARVDATEGLLDYNGFPLASGEGYQAYPQPVRAGNTTFVFYSTSNGTDDDLRRLKVDAEGVVSDDRVSSATTGDDNVSTPSWNGSGFIAGRRDDWKAMNVELDSRAVRMDAEGVVVDWSGFLVSYETIEHDNPAVAFNGNVYLVAWEEQDVSGTDLYASLIGANGTLLKDRIELSARDGYQHTAQVASNGDDFLVVWNDFRPTDPGRYAARISGEGELLDVGGFKTSIGPSFSLASDGSDYRAFYTGYGGLFSRSISAAGIEGPEVAAHENWRDNGPTSIAHNGSEYLAVWFQDRWHSDATVFGMLLTRGGEPLWESPVSISGPNAGGFAMDVASDGDAFYVVFDDDRNYSATNKLDVYGARVSPLGDVSVAPVAKGVEYQFYPSVAFDGRRYVVVWEDYRNGSCDNPRNTQWCNDGDVFGRYVATTGQLLGDAPFDAAPGTTVENGWPHLTGGAMSAGLVYLRYAVGAPWGTVNRVFLRTLESPPPIEHIRSVSLALRRHLIAKGTVQAADGFASCVSRVPVVLQRKASSGWRKVATGTTSSTGTYRVRIADRPGSYRARVRRSTVGVDVCLPDLSQIARHTH